MITINSDVNIAGRVEQHIVQLNISKPIGNPDVNIRGVIHRATLNNETDEVVKVERTIDLNTLGSKLVAEGHVTQEDFEQAYGVIHNAIHAAASAQAQVEDEAKAAAEAEAPAEKEAPAEEPAAGGE